MTTRSCCWIATENSGHVRDPCHYHLLTNLEVISPPILLRKGLFLKEKQTLQLFQFKVSTQQPCSNQTCSCWQTLLQLGYSAGAACAYQFIKTSWTYWTCSTLFHEVLLHLCFRKSLGFVVAPRFFKYRHMKKDDLGPGIEDRHKLREKLQCKSFEWSLCWSWFFGRCTRMTWNLSSFRKHVVIWKPSKQPES